MTNQGPARHTHITADGAVKGGPGQLVGVVLTGAAATCALTLYDNNAASGTVLCTLAAPVNDSKVFTPCIPYVFSIGCYADITGSGATATVVVI